MRRAGFLFAITVVFAGCRAELHHGLDERAANEVIAELDRGGIPADKREGDRPGAWTVLVPRGDQARAVQLLSSRDLPRAGGKGVAEAFADPGLLPSPAAERARLQAALGVDLSRTLQALPGVALARVHVALPDADPLRAEPGLGRATASVLLRVRAGAAVESGEVKRLVAAAVDGLDPADVSVVQSADEAGPAAPPSYVHLGPIALAPSSRGPALALAAFGLLALGSLAAASLLLLARLRRAAPRA